MTRMIKKFRITTVAGICCSALFFGLLAIRLGLFQANRPEPLPITKKTPASYTWHEIYQETEKIGYSHRRLIPRGDGYRLSETTFMRINTMGMVQDINLQTTGILASDMSLSEKKVGVTGSSGFLGSNFLKKLSKVGAKIFMIGRRADPLFSHAERQLTFDFYKAPSLEVKEALQELDYLVHIGAYVPKSSKKEGYDDPLLSVEANIKGILKMLPFLKNVQRIIYASTLEVYGVPKYIPIDENHPTNPTTYYGASKLSCEKYLQVFSKRNNVPITVLRFTTVFGPGEHYQRAIPNFIQAVISKKPIKIFDK